MRADVGNYSSPDFFILFLPPNCANTIVSFSANLDEVTFTYTPELDPSLSLVSEFYQVSDSISDLLGEIVCTLNVGLVFIDSDANVNFVSTQVTANN